MAIVDGVQKIFKPNGFAKRDQPIALQAIIVDGWAEGMAIVNGVQKIWPKGAQVSNGGAQKKTQEGTCWYW